MKVYDILSEDGRIVKGVNTTVDVGPNEIKTQAAKFGNTVDKDGVPPTLSKKVKGKSTNVLFNLGLTEGLWNNIKRSVAGAALDKVGNTVNAVFNDPQFNAVLDNPELLYKDPSFQAASDAEKEQTVDMVIDLVQKRAQGKLTLPPGWKDQVLANIGENSDDSKDNIPYQDLIAQAINDKKMTFVNPNTGEEQSVMNPKHAGNKQKELEFKYMYDYPLTPEEKAALRPWVNMPGDKNLMKMPVTQMTMQQAVDWDMLGHPDMPQATIDAARKRYPNDPRVQNPAESLEENFADGKKPGRKGLAKRSGVNTKASVSSLRKTAKNSSGEKQRMAHWLANMKAGRAKKK